jgi:WD40 repeat protein
MLAAGCLPGLFVWDTRIGVRLRSLWPYEERSSGVSAVAFSPDNKILASGGADKTVRLWSPGDGKELKNIGSHKESVYGVAFSPNGQLLASSSKDTTIKLFDVKGLKELRTFPPLPEPPKVDPKKKDPKKEEKKKDKDKKDKDKKEVKKEEPKKTEPLPLPEIREAITAVQFMPDSQQLLSVGFDKQLHLWNTADGKEIKKLGPTPDDIFGLAISRDGKQFATAGYGGHLLVWDLLTGKPSFAHHLKKMVTYCVTFTPDGKALVTGHEKDNAAVVTPLTK